MTSKLVVNTIEADTGISSVSFASSISMSSTSKFHFGNAGIDIGADTNINRPASGVLGFNINDAEKFRIDSNGHIKATGVCTATHFYGDGSNLTGIAVDSTKIETGNTKVETIDTGSDGHIKVTTEGTERLRITSTGVVLVRGTSVIGSGTGLEVTYTGSSNHGRVLAQGFVARDNYGSATNAGNSMYSPAANTLAFSTNSTERLRITTAGQLVMGATTSKAKFEIKDNGYTSSTVLQRISGDDANPYALIIANDTCNTAAASGLQFFLGDSGTHYIRARGSSTASNNDLLIVAQNDLIFNSGSSESTRARIASNGNFGIGNRTSSPDNLLHVHTASGDSVIHVEAAADPKLRLRAHSGESIVQFADASSSNVGEINYVHSGDYLKFRVNSSERMRISSEGYVTIPNQPSFYGRGYNGHNSGNWKFDAVAASNGEHNQGNHFNNNTGIFTCPVAGHYFIGGGWGYTATADYCMMGFRYNGNTQLNLWEDGRSSKGNLHVSASLGLVIQCNANDTLSFVTHSGYAEPANATVHAWGSIYLVG